MHTVKTSVITSATGQITGYGVTIEAETTGDPDEIQAAIAASFEMIRTAITSQIAAQADPPPGYAPAQPPVDELPPQPAQPATNGHRPPPTTAAEAEQRFFARYGTLIGGKTWMHVRRYLGTAGTRPKTVSEWIDVAELVRDSVQTD